MDAGLVWIGPDPSSITAMGLKDAAKALMEEAGFGPAARPILGCMGASRGREAPEKNGF